MNNKYYCRHCKQTLLRKSDKQWIPSFCDKVGKKIRLVRVVKKKTKLKAGTSSVMPQLNKRREFEQGKKLQAGILKLLKKYGNPSILVINNCEVIRKKGDIVELTGEHTFSIINYNIFREVRKGEKISGYISIKPRI